MKKTFSIIVSIIMVFAMMSALSACSGSSEQEKLLGSWEGTIDMTDYMNQVVAQDDDMAEYVNISNFSFVMELTFNKDGTYKMTANEETVKATFESMQNDLMDGMNRYFEAYIADAGLDMSVEEVLALSGTSLEDMVKEGFSEEMLDSVIDEVSSEGNFKAKGGKLFMSDGLEYRIDENEYETYEVTENELKILAAYGSQAENAEFDVYPMTFKRVA